VSGIVVTFVYLQYNVVKFVNVLGISVIVEHP
jgi:hypothetical protein